MAKKQIAWGVILVSAVMGAVGCASNQAASSMVPMVSQVSMPSPVVDPVATSPDEGSLWNPMSAHLFVDPKAMRVGDTITVDIVENTSSQLDANTSTSRNSEIDAGVAQMLGYMRALEAINPNLNRDNKGSLNNTLLKANLTNKFDGKGTSDRSGRVTASIGARVVEVLPNGNLVIVGRRETKVNRETQFIAISGIVRPMDIDGDNRVKSTYLADARIEYYGSGTLADKQQPGWLTRVIDYAWPF